MERAKAWELLRAYNKDHFHLQHALTVEAVMRWFANDLGYGAEADYWGVVGLLHDIDFELYPEQHCVKCGAAAKRRRAGGYDSRDCFPRLRHLRRCRA